MELRLSSHFAWGESCFYCQLAGAVVGAIVFCFVCGVSQVSAYSRADHP